MKLYEALKKANRLNIPYMYIDGINTQECYIFDCLLSDIELKNVIDILDKDVIKFNIEGICIDITIID